MTPLPFQRFTAADPAGHEARIASQQARLAAAADDLALVDASADLATLLTTARREAEALAVLAPHLERARHLPQVEPAGWFWNAHATALQYSDRRDEADPVFAQALALCEAGGWQRLQSIVLQHWGRCLVEQGRLDEAQNRFEQALTLRRALDDPRAATTEAALTGLTEVRRLLQGSCHCGAVRLTLPWLPAQATRCNCSLCRRVGGTWAYYPVGRVLIEGHPERTQGYAWGDKTLTTVRCAHCGSVTHWDPLNDTSAGRHGVNLNNFDPQVLAGAKLRHFDGAETWTFLD